MCFFFLANNVTQQKLQCIKGEDGKLQFKGLLPGNLFSMSILNKFKFIVQITNIGQQLIQLPDGKLHVTNYVQSPGPRTVQISKNTILSNNNNFTKTGPQVSY